MPIYIWTFAVALVVALLVTPLVILLAKKTGAMDAPDARKVHKKPIPRIGGLAIYAGFMAAIIFVAVKFGFDTESIKETIGLMLSGSLIVAVGLIDDYKNLPAKVKLLGQIIAAAVLVLFFDVRIDFVTDPFGEYFYFDNLPIPYLAVIVTMFWLVGLTNTVNLIDGLDGLAAGVASIASFTILLIALEQKAAVGFLKYNFHPAQIFMGDTGSMFLGFMLAGISVTGAVKSVATIALIVPIFALGLPILDTTFAIVRRLRGGVPIFKPDKGHLHHRLLSVGFTQCQAVLLMYVISALFGLSAIALTAVSYQIAVLILFVVVVAIIYGVRKLGIARPVN